MRTLNTLVRLVGGLSLVWSAAAQTDIPAVVTHTFPFGASNFAIGEGNRVYMGAGGGIFVLNASADLNPQLDASAGENRIRSGGLTWEIELTSTLVHAAAGKQGYTRFKRLADHDPAEGLGFDDVGNCRAIAVEQVGNKDVVFLGTNETDVGGKVRLVTCNSDGSGTPQLEATWDAGVPVYSLATYRHGDVLTLLVGTACGVVSGGQGQAFASVFRFDFDVTGDVPPDSIPIPSGSWSPLVEASPGVLVHAPGIARDIVIDEVHQIAYIATQTKGVHRVLLATGGLTEDTGTGWPIMPGYDIIGDYVGVDYYAPSSSEQLLVVTLGFKFPGDRQEWGGCSSILACDDPIGSARDPDETGIKLFEVSGGPIELATVDKDPAFGVPPMSAKVRPVDENSFYIDVAALSHGTRIVKAVRSGSTDWTLTPKGDFAVEDTHMVSSCDDLLRMGNNVFVSGERVLTAFDASLSATGAELLDVHEPGAWDLSGAVLLTGFEASGGYPTMLFSSDYTQVTFKQVTFGTGGLVQSMQQVGSGRLALDGRGPELLAVGPGATPDREDAPWLFAVLGRADDTIAGCTGSPPFNSGIQAWRLPLPGSGPPLPDAAQSIGDWLPPACPGPAQPCPAPEQVNVQGQFMDAWTDMTSSSNVFTFFVSYGPRGDEHDAGLLAVKGELILGSTPSRDKICWTFLGKVPAFEDTDLAEMNVARITWSPDGGGRLYVALACHGVAVYAYHGVGALPTLEAVWPGDGRSAMQATRIVEGGSDRVYVTFIDGGVGVFDTNLIEKGEIRMPGQPNALLQVPSVGGAPAFLLADGQGGVQRVELVQPPPLGAGFGDRMPALQEPAGMLRSLRTAATGGAALAVVAVVVWMARGSERARAAAPGLRSAPSWATRAARSPYAASSHSVGRGVPLLFAENRGQMPSAARFVAHTGLPLWLTDKGLRMRLTPGPPPRLDPWTARANPVTTKAAHAPQVGAAVFLTFEDARSDVRLVGLTPAPTKLHYFLGNEPTRWVTKVPTWTRVAYQDLYPGIDVQVHGEDGVAEYDLVLHPFADLEEVVLRVEGADALRVDRDGSLLIETAAGSLRQSPPETWDVGPGGERRPLACEFRILDATHYGFSAPGHDHSRKLVVDPELAYSTLLGGNVNDIGLDIAVDASGCAVVVGESSGNPASFPTTPGAFQTTSTDSSVGFVTKVNAAGSGLVFSTYLGGSGSGDDVEAVALHPDGSITVAGVTPAANFPVTPSAYDISLGGLSDAFVSRLSADGSEMIFSTYIGGDLGTEDATAGIALDTEGRVVLALSSTSDDFPTTANAYSSTPGPYDATVGRLSADGSTLEYGSWIPGAATPYGMTLAGESRATIVGVGSNGLPLTPGAIDTTKSFGEGFIVTMDVETGTLEYASYLGGSFNDWALDVTSDGRGALYVTGTTESFDFPVTSGSFDTHINGVYDDFVVKLSPDGSILQWSTFLGGVGDDEGRRLGITPDGSVVVASEATSNFPMTPDAFDSAYNGHTALGLSVISADGSQLLFGTYLGGNEEWVLQGNVCVDNFGAAYVTGYTADNLFPTTPGAFDIVRNGFSDSFVAKFRFGPWNGAGPGLAGTGGTTPQLLGDGSLQPGSAGSISLTQAKPLAQAFLLVGLSHLDAPFKGGTMAPNPLLLFPLSTDASGSRVLSWSNWPSGLPAGTELLMQYWIVDAAAPAGFAASNGLSAVVP